MRRVVGGIGTGLGGSFLSHLLPIAPRQPRAPRGSLGGAGPVKPGGPEGGDAVSSESEKATDLASCRRNSNGRRRPLTTGRRRWPNPSLLLLVPMDRLIENLPHRHTRSSKGRTANARQGRRNWNPASGARRYNGYRYNPMSGRRRRGRWEIKNEKKCSRTSVDV